jgi:hypothetical protein
VGEEVQVSIFEGGLQEENKSLGLTSLVRKKKRGIKLSFGVSKLTRLYLVGRGRHQILSRRVCVCVCVFFVLMKDRG